MSDRVRERFFKGHFDGEVVATVPAKPFQLLENLLQVRKVRTLSTGQLNSRGPVPGRLRHALNLRRRYSGLRSGQKKFEEHRVTAGLLQRLKLRRGHRPRHL